METTLTVTGMICDRCVNAVSSELSAITEVEQVNVELAPGGASAIRLESTAPLEEAILRAAVEEAGYTITSIT